ncbi:hypothetical protein ACA910_020018 [Epithemia clementina (nom. ined.)]
MDFSYNFQDESWPVTIEDIPPDAMNVLTSFLRLSDFVSLSLCSSSMYSAVSGASHLSMDDPFDWVKQTVPSNTLSSSAAKANGRARCSSSRCSRVSDQFLTRLLSRYENLTSLHLSWLGPLGDSLFPILNQAKAASRIQQLSLNGVNLTYWCQDALRFENLQHLEISSSAFRAPFELLLGMSNHSNQRTTSSTSSQPICSLQSLSISRCSSLRDDQLQRVVSHVNQSLQNLTLTQCLRLRSPVIKAPRLKHLSLMGCFALQELPYFHCPSLQSLNLSFCFRLTNDCIHCILGTLSQLEELNLAKCLMLHDLQLESVTLKSLIVGHCDSLSFLRLKCPRLEVLNTDACFSLDTLILEQAHALRDLSVSVLPVTRLEVMAPHLSQLNLANCKRLDRCSIHAPNLQHVNVHGSRTVALRFCKEVRSVQIRNWTRMPYQF